MCFFQFSPFSFPFFYYYYSVPSAVNEITKAKDPFEACAASLKNAIFYRQQLRYRDSRK
jgi:hypothetical protein